LNFSSCKRIILALSGIPPIPSLSSALASLMSFYMSLSKLTFSFLCPFSSLTDNKAVYKQAFALSISLHQL